MAGQTLAVVSPDTTKTYTPRGGNDTVTDVTNLPYPLGSTVEVNDSSGLPLRYKFVMVKDLALVAGDGVCYTTADDNIHVTSDRAGGTSDNEQPAGLAVVACATGKACWIQSYGLNTVAMVTDGGVTNGEALIPHATTDGGLDSSSATADTPYDTFGQALDDDTGTALPIGKVFLRCR